MPDFPNPDDYARAREVVAAANYTEQGLRESLGGSSLLAIPAIEIPPWLHATRGLSPHETLLRLFHLGTAVPEQAARRAVAPMALEDWVAAELLAPPDGEGEVASRVKLLPVLGGVFAADMPQLQTATVPHDYVLPPGATTLQLAHAMIDRPARRTLDLGTGCGAVACAAARHSEVVVATDKNERAVHFARFNVRLNGVDRVECVAGDLFEPVEGQRFDLIVCNPPFVISPSTQLLFRDSGVRGDVFCRHLIRGAAERLEEGGFCQVQCNCAQEAGRPWTESLAEWFEGLGCDVLVWLDRRQSIADYAMTWIVSTESDDPAKAPGIFKQWMAYYEQQRIEAVSYVLVNLRRRGGGGNWTAIEESTRQVAGPCGEIVLRGFAARDFLATHQDDAKLMAVHVRLAEGTVIEQKHAMGDEGLAVVETLLHLGGGAQLTLGLDPNVADLIAHCDGKAPLGKLVEQFAASLGLDAAKVAEVVLRVVRTLIERGVLVPVHGTSDS